MALNLNSTFTSGWNANANKTAFNAVLTQVLADINTYFNINCSIDYQWDYGSSPGSANTSIVFTSPVTYAAMLSLLAGVPSDALKAIAYSSANLPTSEGLLSAPYSGTVYSWPAGLDSILKGTTWTNNVPFTYLGTTISNSVTWSTAADGSTSSGQSSLYGVIWHELSEALGRSTQLGNSNISTLDLFVFKSSSVRSWLKTDTRYFSYHNGASNDTTPDVNSGLGFYNSGTGDWGGWGGSYVSPFNEQNFTTSNGKSGYPLPGDIRQLAALGWPLTSAGEAFAQVTSSHIGRGLSFTRNL